MNQSKREEIVADVLNEMNIDDGNVSVRNADGEQVEEDIPELENLSTPVNLIQEEKKDQSAEKKKKRKKKSKTANLPEAGSELADDYIEKKNEDLVENPFSPDNSLAQRVEYAIWKYRNNHKFTESKKAIFDNYLKFGCIVTGPNMFQGRATSADTPADPDADIDFTAAKAETDAVPDDAEECLEVNFAEVAQVYLGNTFIRSSRFIELQNFIDAPALIDSFLRYLEIRNVAPEYAEDIAKARAICTEAKLELPKCKRAMGKLPGYYNTACSELFQESPDTSWMQTVTLAVQKQLLSFVADTVGSNSEESKKIVQKQIKNPDAVHFVSTENCVDVKIAEIWPYDDSTDKEDLIQVNLENQEIEKSYIIYLEKDIVENLMVGMIFTADLCKLSNGEWFLGKAQRLMPTFFMEDTCMTEDDYDF